MARIRTIKPEFWTSEQVMECSPIARLLFVGLWNFCDDGGNHSASCRQLKAEVFPGDDITIDEIQNLMDELIDQNLVVRYTADDKIFWHVTGWHHQKIEKKNYKHPEFQENLMILPEKQAKTQNSTTEPQPIIDQSATIRRPFDDHSTTEGKGRERKGEEGNGEEKTHTSSCVSVKNGSGESKSSDAVLKVFDYWRETMSSPKSVLDDKRRRKIKTALTHHPPDDLCKAIFGCSLSPFHMGDNPQKTKYNGVDLIFRDAEKIEQFMGFADNPPKPQRRDETIAEANARIEAEIFGRKEPYTIEMEA